MRGLLPNAETTKPEHVILTTLRCFYYVTWMLLTHFEVTSLDSLEATTPCRRTGKKLYETDGRE